MTDSLGIPLTRLSGRLHPNDLSVQQLLGERAADWLRAAYHGDRLRFPPGERGAEQRPAPGRTAGWVRPYGRVRGHPNLRVIDGSLHITNGGVNPVLTIFANAFRIMHTWVGSGRDYL